eukprot:TRINITY_DN2493_c0_g2_i1.p1 TRINITY_DN2493_c0_g2~~TRINITY_DN2493_c0_g2_i1.p1  ORF type:complete len:206 (+),score=37.18 TRINITY_DN2493_c0_g2_i1:103-720(+)
MSTAYDPFESTGDSDDEKSSQTPLPTDRDVVTAKDVLGTKTPPATNQDNSTREISLGRDWQEFETPDGRKYYHNPKLGQTQWRMPEEYKEFLRKEKEKERIEDEIGFNQDKTYTKDELREFYAKLLRYKKMTSMWSQDQCFSITRDHPLWCLLKISERRQVIQNLKAELREEEREEARKKFRQQEEAFVQLLLESPYISIDTPFR